MKADENFLEAIENAIEDGEYTPTEWEETFIPSVREQMDAGRPLSRKQRETIDRIHEKVQRRSRR